ncbi:MAG: hypothetical protein ACRERD_23925 [Candidatus Binatia bacterium]
MTGVGLLFDGIHVTTEHPELLPSAVEGLPIKPRVPGQLPVAGKIPYKEAEGIFERNQGWLRQLAGVREVRLATRGIEVITR